jgi:hydrogenase maturation protein HypF
VVLLDKKQPDAFFDVAPKLDKLGFMLPYTPLHHLLLNQTDAVLSQESPAPAILVMTSGNRSGEPLAAENDEALSRLLVLADAFLLHDRSISMRCDDSVVQLDRTQATPIFLRRSRGYAPYPVRLPFAAARPLLAVGGELKNTFCLADGQQVFLSQHIGEMEDAATCAVFEQSVAHFSRLFRLQPELVAHDLHPNYFTTRYAHKLDLQEIAVQHHHAHIAACMADNGLTERSLIGLAFDGTGYGTDGKIWGGEVLLVSYAGFERLAHLEYLPLPGGDAAIRHPWRIALGYAYTLDLDLDGLPFLLNIDKQAASVIKQQVDKRLNAPLTSSIGRLFDAVASLIGIRNHVSYEAQAAMELEVLSKPFIASAAAYPYTIDDIIQVKELFKAIIRDLRANEPVGLIGARFHQAIAWLAIDLCQQARDVTGLNEVALSGGVWQNQTLLQLVRQGLTEAGFTVYVHQQVPTNDGGVALGQAVVALAMTER